MGLDRTELAARLAEADWRNPRAEPLPLGEWGRTLVAYADDLIAALALTPPVAGPCPGEDARDDAEARKRIAGRPPIVCLCGSTRFIDTFQSEYGRLTDEGNIVLSVGRVVPQSEQALGSERKVALDALHLRKIDLCDRVLVLNVGGYVGPSTRREIEYAKAHSKPVDLLYPDAGLDGQPPVAPKSEAAKYEPRVGDVVRYDDTNAGDEMIVSRIEGGITYWRYLRVRGGADISSFQPSALRFIRPATPAERAAAGLPSPEATRPTHDAYARVVAVRDYLDLLVRIQPETLRITAALAKSIGYVLPTPPAPVEPAKPGTVENMAAHLAWCAWCGTDGRSELPYDAFRAGYLAALAARGAP